MQRGDAVAAKEHLQQASEQGLWAATAQLAALLIELGDTEGARELLEDHGSAAAMNQLAKLSVSLGEHEEARAWLTRAASAGDAAAMGNLALFMERGVGGPCDMEAAADWRMRALAAESLEQSATGGEAAGTEDDIAEKSGWEGSTAPEVRSLLSVSRSVRDVFRPDLWQHYSELSVHMAVATRLLGPLRAAKRVLDLGCGTGALLAIFAELGPEARLEGVESDGAVAVLAAERLGMVGAHFERHGMGEAARAARGAAEGVVEGDAFEFNRDNDHDGVYDVVNVGFALLDDDVPASIWDAVAEGGVLALPICDLGDDGSPVRSGDGKCKARFHLFTKFGRKPYPGSRAPLGAAHQVIDIAISYFWAQP